MCVSWLSHTSTNIFSFQSHQLIFSHASADVRGENTPETKVASIGDRTHNHHIMSLTRSPLSLLCQNSPQSNFSPFIFPVFFQMEHGTFTLINQARTCTGTSVSDRPLMWYKDGRFSTHRYLKFTVHNIIMRKRTLEQHIHHERANG